jgi:hypothetical protein
MIAKYELLVIRRAPLRTVAIFLAFVVMTVMLTVSLSMSIACRSALSRVDEEYTTVVHEMPLSSPSSVLEMEQYNILSQQKRQNQDLMLRYGAELEQPLLFTYHSMLAAYTEDVTPRLTANEAMGSHSYMTDQPNNLVILAVRCESVVDLPSVKGFANKSGKFFEIPRGAYRLTVEETVMAHPDIVIAQTLIVQSGIRMVDQSIPFVEGERYLIWGVYEGGSDSFGTLQMMGDVELPDELSTVRLGEDGINLFGRLEKDGEEIPLIAVLGQMAVSDFLKTEAWSAWAPVRKLVDVSMHSLQLFSTDSILIHESFLNRSAYLVSGRDFSEQERENGEKVCVIHEELAKRNGLAVGDRLALTCYRTPFETGSGTLPYVRPISFYSEQSERSVVPESGEYTVVGIYGTGDQGASGMALHPNTILVPQSAWSIKNISHPYEDFTIVLPNGGEEAFREEVASYGMTDLFFYDDGGYSEIMPHLTAMAKSIRSITVLCFGIWVLMATALGVLFCVMQKSHAQVKFRLGVPVWRIWLQTLGSMVLLIVPSVALGAITSVGVYDTALEWLMNSGFTVFYGAFGKRDTAEILSELFRLLGQTSRVFWQLGLAEAVVIGVWFIMISACLVLRRRLYRM